jgi:LacI family repressor for deo operon, udp, cdd, tsx, nupC, and nupG
VGARPVKAGKIGLAQVAAQADVSEATVSRVINGKPGVADATRAAVLTAIDVLGYELPPRLRPRTGSLVGLIVPELTNPIFPAFAQTIETGLAMRGFTPVLCTQTPGGLHEDVYVQMLLDRGVAGIICVSGQHADLLETVDRYVALTDQGIPLVLVNGYREGVRAAFVSSDDDAAIELALRHLVELGHRRIGLAVGQAQYVPVRDKVAAFRRLVAAQLPDLDLEDFVVTSLFSVEGGGLAARRLIERGATAIIFGSDLMALGAIQQAQRMGLSVPQDLSIVGFDDSPLMGFTQPPLTTLRQKVMEMSEVVVQALLAQIRGDDDAPPELVFRPELVVRGSTARVPGSGTGTVATPERGMPGLALA